jgi:microcystin-dependent protein
MALESASFIAGLNQANPLATDSVAQADDHIRLIKSVLKNTFPNLTGAVTATQSQLNTPVPVGFIGMWSGSTAAVPTGWALCDGTNGTPDLRDRFIVGAGTTYAVGATGGANTVTLTTSQIPSHTHDISGSTGNESASHTHVFSGTTNTAGAHTHTLSGYGKDGSTFSWPDLEGRGSFRTISNGVNSAGDHSHTVSGTTQTASTSHTHTFSGSTTVTGGGASHENRPPYYALAYIMKV